VERKERERFIEERLWRKDWRGLAAMNERPGLVFWRLIAMLQSPDRRLALRAVVALGRFAASLRPGEPNVTEAVKGLFWMMNDESGNLCRLAPEAIAEILAARPELRPSFAPLIPQYLLEEPFEAGALWAMLRLARAGHEWKPSDARGLAVSLRCDDPRRRRLAQRLAGKLGPEYHHKVTVVR
jgi:hypothetical protein